jgi:hypothetical protein
MAWLPTLLVVLGLHQGATTVGQHHICPARGYAVPGVGIKHPPSYAFDYTQLIGEPLILANATAGIHGCVLRVVKRDGHPVAAVTQEYLSNRIDVWVSGGLVTHTGIG